MKRCAILVLLVLTFVVFVGNVNAESIKGRLGITGQVGFLVPSDGQLTPEVASFYGIPQKLNIDSGFAGGGGLIFGLTDNLAIEAHVAYAPSLDVKNAGVSLTTKLHTIDASFGLQIRNNLYEEHLAAYLGGGADVLFSDADAVLGVKPDVSTVVGGHVNVGGDYFITKNFALNLDLRGVFFSNANVKYNGSKVAEYDPISFIGLVGVRWFPW